MKKRLTQTAAATALALGLAGCSHQTFVACYGVAKPGSKTPYVVMDQGLCTRLAGGIVKPLPKGVKAPAASNNYVMCYGVAAAGKNDCGTKTTACSGSINVAKDPNAWIATLKGVCEKIGGRVASIHPEKVSQIVSKG